MSSVGQGATNILFYRGQVYVGTLVYNDADGLPVKCLALCSTSSETDYESLTRRSRICKVVMRVPKPDRPGDRLR